jgi:chemotaxis methyl-accepting protein methylase
VYAREALEELPETLATRYLEPVHASGGPRFRVCDEIRSRVRFSRHDLTSPLPAPGEGSFELVACRNVLIYLRREAQMDALAKVRAAVVGGGFLFLGEAEWPSSPVAETLIPRGHKTRLFQAISPAVGREGL